MGLASEAVRYQSSRWSPRLPGDLRMRNPLFSLTQRIPRRAVEVAKVFGFNKVKACLRNSFEQSGNLAMVHGFALVGGKITAAPVIGDKGLFPASGPNFDSPVGDHVQD